MAEKIFWFFPVEKHWVRVLNGHSRQSRKPDVSLSDTGMAVFVGAEGRVWTAAGAGNDKNCGAIKEIRIYTDGFALKSGYLRRRWRADGWRIDKEAVCL